MPMTFREMLKPHKIGEITRGDLKALSLDRLEAFAKLLGVPRSGGKRKRLTKMIGGFVAPTKYSLAVGLLNWRLRCRRAGQNFYEEMRRAASSLPQQKRLF